MSKHRQDNRSRTTATGTVAPPQSFGCAPQDGGASVPLAAVHGDRGRKRDDCVTRQQSRPVTEFRCTYRRLPHWQSPGEVYFVTFRTAERRVLQPQERNTALSACRFWDGKKIDLYAAVVMPDHVHLLLQPRQVENKPDGVYDLAEVLHSIKSFSAHEIAAHSEIRIAVWQHESYDRIVRDETEFNEKWTYISNNAVVKKLAREPEQYPWFWYREMKDITTASETLAPPSAEAHEKSGGGATVPVANVNSGSSHVH